MAADVLDRASRSGRSLFSLNRGREFSSLCKMLELEPRDALLDVGSGDGYLTARFSRRVGHVTGLEPDDALIGHARKFNRGRNIRYEQGLAEALPFPDATFEKVVSVSSVEHFRDPVRGLGEMFRVLRPGGRLAISVDTLCPENSTIDFRQWHAARHQATRYFREKELVSILTEIGFRVDGPVVHMFRSPLARWARETFIRQPRVMLPLFPLFRVLVALGDALPSRNHGQIIALGAARSPQAESRP
jgi:SAM-dependent methyltransferase